MHLRGSLSNRTNFQSAKLSAIASRMFLGSPSAGGLPWLSLGLAALFLTLQFPQLIWLVGLLGILAIRFSAPLSLLANHPCLRAVGGWKTIGVLAGLLLFVGITIGADPAFAIFDKAEQQASSIFGQYVDAQIITFLFGLLRLVVWITAVGFILFAVYQAQRGEQWQPLMQNAFIVIAAVVVVEGLSAMFFK